MTHCVTWVSMKHEVLLLVDCSPSNSVTVIKARLTCPIQSSQDSSGIPSVLMQLSREYMSFWKP